MLEKGGGMLRGIEGLGEEDAEEGRRDANGNVRV